MQMPLVETARTGDAPRLAELEALCFAEPRSEGALLGELGDPGRYLLLAARLDGELAGYAGLEYVLDEGYVTDVAVFPEFRRRGVAKALLRELERRARGMGLRFLTLEARPSNTPAVSLYAALGYEEAGRRRDFYRNPREDALLMTLWLSSNRAATGVFIETQGRTPS